MGFPLLLSLDRVRTLIVVRRELLVKNVEVSLKVRLDVSKPDLSHQLAVFFQSLPTRVL